MRGVAALIVVFQHIAGAFYPDLISGPAAPGHAFLRNTPLAVLWAGDLAVAVFFVHSGLVLALDALRTDSADRLEAAAWRRPIRLGIPCAASIALSMLVARWFGAWNHPFVQATGPNSWGLANFYPATLSIRQGVREALGVSIGGGSVDWNPQLWTLSIELLASYLVFGLVAITRRSAGKLAAIGALFFLVFGAARGSLWYGAFLAGVVLAAAIARGGDATRSGTTLRVARRSAFGIAMYLGAWPFGPLPWMFQPATILFDLLRVPGDVVRRWELAHIVAGFLIVWLVVTGPRLQRFFERGPLAWLGRVSFGLYLLHFVTLCTVGCWVALTLLRHGYGRAVAFAAASIVTLAVSLGAADLFSRLVDQPSIRLARRVGARLSRSRKRVTGHGCPNGRTCRHGRVVPARLPGLDP